MHTPLNAHCYQRYRFFHLLEVVTGNCTWQPYRPLPQVIRTLEHTVWGCGFATSPFFVALQKLIFGHKYCLQIFSPPPLFRSKRSAGGLPERLSKYVGLYFRVYALV